MWRRGVNDRGVRGSSYQATSWKIRINQTAHAEGVVVAAKLDPRGGISVGNTPGFVANKRGHACRPSARFASVAFVTGALDPLSDRVSFQALLAPPPAPTLILCGESTPAKSKAENGGDSVQPRGTHWVAGSLGLHE